MIERVTKAWTGSPPVEFESAFDLAQSIDRLRAATKRSAFSAMAQQVAVGTVRETRVSLHRAIPMVGNSFKPIFVGRFEQAGGKVVLRGSFAMHWFTKLFMILWFGVLIVAAIATLAAGIGADSPETWMGLPVIVGMIGAGFLLVKTGQWFSRKDPAWLSNVIASALCAPGTADMTAGPAPASAFGVPIHLLGFAGLVALEGVLHLVSAIFPIEMFGSEGMPRPLSALSGGLMLVWAYGICRLDRLAWWAGLLCFAYWGFSVFEMVAHPPPAIEELSAVSQSAEAIFAAVSLVMFALLGRWWYAQRMHFH